MSTVRDVVVIGGSAGAIEALLRLVGGLPGALPARIFVTIHLAAGATSVLPKLLTRAGSLPASHASDGERTTPGAIRVAPPDHHLLVRPGAMQVTQGPRENGHRPAVDPLFRSAAASYGDRVIGVVLSGNLDDGSAGAQAIHAAGGSVIVQDPDDAMYSGMPANALAAVPSATVLPLERIAEHLVRMIALGDIGPHGSTESRPSGDAVPAYRPPVDPVELGVGESERFSKHGVASGLTCPECHGGIFELDAETAGSPQYRCRVGHAFSGETLLAEQKASLEVALWTAVRALEEAAELARRMEHRTRTRSNGRASARYHQEAHLFDARARTVRDVLRSGVPVAEREPGSSGAAT